MDITGLLHSLRMRASWFDARKVLLLAGLDPGQGWDRTVDRYEDLDVEDEQGDTLSDLLIEHTIAGEKALQFYRLKRNQLDALKDKVDKLRVPKSPASEAYPELIELPTGTLDGASQSEVVYKSETADGVFVVSSAVREYDERVEIEMDNLATGTRNAFVGYSHLIGVRSVRRQVFDVLWLPTQGTTVCVAADCPRGAPGDFVHKSQTAIRSFMTKSIGEKVEPKNLFPAIEKSYESDWGKVVELGFTTDTASVKHERMRLKRQCLREELFHVGGKEAVDGIIHPFQISIDWKSVYSQDPRVQGRPEATLHGTARMLHQPVPTIYDVVFRHGLRVKDLRLVKSKIMSFL
ncbi:hypothetical protein IHE49_07220 [Rhodanobacter sp. 7MK24]|uniref:hypothetical protein n=1 Tax=Rhodanobacter sp. 7MK24 TaxID=2775922 RepID=UPI001782D740|nr:hypothetical protein [Rhodanobacter sp. 7MK24]MBD8880267.1 hypothetical protein [Rhodanobacter sp. 7MK24]